MKFGKNSKVNAYKPEEVPTSVPAQSERIKQWEQRLGDLNSLKKISGVNSGRSEHLVFPSVSPKISVIRTTMLTLLTTVGASQNL